MRGNDLAGRMVECIGTPHAYGGLKAPMPVTTPWRPKPQQTRFKPGRSEMIEQPTTIPWSDDYSDEDEMIDFVVAASEMLEELLARPQPNYLRSRLIHLHKQSLVFPEDYWLH
jgi:hypothetical protein